MKTLILVLFFAIPFMGSTQKLISLTVKQSPEFGFLIPKQDTTIVKGGSVVLGTELGVFGGSGEYNFSWSPTATLSDSTVVNPVATPLDTTTYQLTVTDNSGCSFSINYTVNTREKMVNNEILSHPGKLQAVLFPNPNEGKFKVKINGIPSEKIELCIIDLSGQVFKSQTIRNFNGDHIETIEHQLISGVYILRIQSGTETLSQNFIIL